MYCYLYSRSTFHLLISLHLIGAQCVRARAQVIKKGSVPADLNIAASLDSPESSAQGTYLRVCDSASRLSRADKQFPYSSGYELPGTRSKL